MVIPNIVRNEPIHLQRAFIKEFEKIYDETSSAVMAYDSAVALLNAVKFKPIAERTETLEKQVIFAGEIAELDSDIIPKNILNQVKQIDPHPFFAVYKIGKDGLSRGEKIRKIWSFGAIKELAKSIKNYAADIIEGHTKGTEEKPTLGKVIYSYTKNIGKSLYAYAVAHITNDETKERIKNGELDLCSVEGDVLFSRKGVGDWFIDKVLGIKKLALANSENDKAGFADAGIVTTIQELESKGNEDMAGESKVDNLSVYEVKVAIEKLNLKPKDLFRSLDLLEVDSVKKYVESEVDKAKEEKQKEINGLAKKLEPFEAKERSAKLSGFVEKSPLLTDKPKKLREYITDKIASLDVKDVDDSVVTSKVDEFIKKQLDDVEKYNLKFEDSDDDDDGKAQDGKKSETTKKATKKKPADVDLTDPIAMADPEVNDNIPD